MPQKISSDIVRICKRCKQEFKPHARKQFYCGEVREFKCEFCGKSFKAVCNNQTKSTCSVECQANLIKCKRSQSAKAQTKLCKWCGDKFIPTSPRDVYCRKIHYQTCCICGNSFEIDVRRDSSVKTCSIQCKKILSLRNRDIEQEHERQKEVLIEKYGVDNPSKIPGVIEKVKSTNLKKYGVEWYTQTDEYKQRAKETDLAKYGVDYHLQSETVKKKREETCLEKYGVDNIAKSDVGKNAIQKSLLEKYGVKNASQYPAFKSKATASAKKSKFEERVCKLLTEYNVEFKQHYILKKDNLSHEFDIYLPKYKFLIDCDGLYYHSYLDDLDGKRVLDCYDEIRLELIPSDYLFHVIVEGQEEKDIKYIVNILKQMDSEIFNYEGELFRWCRSIEFPYPQYSTDRMKRDYKHLCSYNCETYKPTARLGMSAITQFHRSIFDAHVGSHPSPKQAWNDDNLLKRVITNRLIYKNDVDPYKVMKGFNISKVGPQISLFNPVLARYLTLKYLDTYSTIFDPFSGYSGRLLGVTSTMKRYIGQDINKITIDEAKQLASALNLQNHDISCKDILESSGEYQCILTCPPYFDKERYGNETIFKTCDEWIGEILERFACEKYVFVVDKTEKYKDRIVEELKSSSHLSEVTEYVIAI